MKHLTLRGGTSLWQAAEPREPYRVRSHSRQMPGAEGVVKCAIEGL